MWVFPFAWFNIYIILLLIDKKRGERASVVSAAAEPDEAANGDIDNCSVVSNQSGSQGTVGGLHFFLSFQLVKCVCVINGVS